VAIKPLAFEKSKTQGYVWN